MRSTPILSLFVATGFGFFGCGATCAAPPGAARPMISLTSRDDAMTSSLPVEQ